MDPFDSSPEPSPRRVSFGGGSEDDASGAHPASPHVNGDYVDTDDESTAVQTAVDAAQAASHAATKARESARQAAISAASSAKEVKKLAKEKTPAPTRLDALLSKVIADAETSGNVDDKLKAAKLASDILLKRPEPPAAVGPLEPPEAEDQGDGQFNSLRAIVAITRRIFDTKLLPPHSRTLNYSLLKRLLETTALFSNRQVKDFYKLYKKSDVTSDDLVNVTDASLRQQKKDIREYVDRLLCPKVFLETEIEGNHFTSAFTDCMEYFKSKRVTNRTMRLLSEPTEPLLEREDAARRNCFEPAFEWKSVTGALADVILRHADMRGNIVVDRSRKQTFTDSSFGEMNEELMDRYNWYNSWQHAWGDVYKQYLEVKTSADTESVKIQRMVEVFRLYRRQAKTVLAGALSPPNFDSWKAVVTYVETTSGWGVHKLIQAELDHLAHASTDEPLTAFDVALLGGLHPRTYAIEVNAKKQRGGTELTDDDYRLSFKTDEFFEMCMAHFDTNGTGVEDLGYRIFLTPLVRRSLHTSYLPFRRVESEPPKKPLVRFGAPSVVAAAGPYKPGKPVAKDEEEAEQPAKRQRPSEFSLEVYCESCFERGAELYIRLVHEMVKSHLEVLRNVAPEPEVLTPFSKLIGLTIQRAELLNPLIKMGANASYNRDMRRNNNRATTEARVQLARACGFAPDIYLDGYAL